MEPASLYRSFLVDFFMSKTNQNFLLLQFGSKKYRLKDYSMNFRYLYLYLQNALFMLANMLAELPLANELL